VTTQPDPPTKTTEPLPIETVRDLLGIVRVMYALQRSKGNHGHARELQSAGQRLKRALELVLRMGDRQAHAAAWQLAEAALVSIARVQSSSSAGDDLTVIVRLASQRVRARSGDRGFKIEDRDLRRRARIKRG
jgi:hypothetical protein